MARLRSRPATAAGAAAPDTEGGAPADQPAARGRSGRRSAAAKKAASDAPAREKLPETASSGGARLQEPGADKDNASRGEVKPRRGRRASGARDEESGPAADSAAVRRRSGRTAAAGSSPPPAPSDTSRSRAHASAGRSGEQPARRPAKTPPEAEAKSGAATKSSRGAADKKGKDGKQVQRRTCAREANSVGGAVSSSKNGAVNREIAQKSPCYVVGKFAGDKASMVDTSHEYDFSCDESEEATAATSKRARGRQTKKSARAPRAARSLPASGTPGGSGATRRRPGRAQTPGKAPAIAVAAAVANGGTSLRRPVAADVSPTDGETPTKRRRLSARAPKTVAFDGVESAGGVAAGRAEGFTAIRPPPGPAEQADPLPSRQPAPDVGDEPMNVERPSDKPSDGLVDKPLDKLSARPVDKPSDGALVKRSEVPGVNPRPAEPPAATPRRRRLPRHVTSTPVGPAAAPATPAPATCYGFLEEEDEQESSPLEQLVSPVGERRARPPARPLRDATNLPSRFTARLPRKPAGPRPEVTTTVASQLMDPEVTFSKPASRSYSRRHHTGSRSTLGQSSIAASEASTATDTAGETHVKQRRHRRKDDEFEEELDKWAASVNSMLSEVDDFELVVEHV